MAHRLGPSGEIAVSSHTNGVIGLICSGLGFGPILTTTDDHAETS